MKLNRKMMQMRHLNPELYKLVNHLWKVDIGIENLFKLKFVLTYFIKILEDYLVLCETRFQQISQNVGVSLPMNFKKDKQTQI
jgi:hypothetical protein